MGFILVLLAVSLGINIILFLVAYRLQSDKLTDASYAVTFIALAAAALSQAPHHTAYRWVATGMVGAWALRIGGFLLYRVMRTGKDARFDGMRESFWKFGKFWVAQGLSVWVIMLAAVWAVQRGGRWQALAGAGVAVWLAGLLLEATADWQKYRFTSDPAHKGQWIDCGVWRYSRHPNYFGEMLVWAGVYLYAFGALSGPERIAAAASPLFIICLLLFVSGIPILEKSADSRWGSNPAYQAYKRRTSLLIPWPPRGSRT